MVKQRKTKEERSFSTAKYHPFIATIKFFARLVQKRPEVVFLEPIPKDEAVVICPNHCKEYGATAMVLYYPRPNRPWTNSNLFFASRVPNHVMFYGCYNTHGLARFFARIGSYLAAIVSPGLVKGIEGIPCFYNDKLSLTAQWSAETLAEGKDVVVFPESPDKDPDNIYVNMFQNGFARIDQSYFALTGKTAKFYPAYICHELKKIVIGHPVTFERERNFKVQVKEVKQKIRDQIKEIAQSLPPHTPTQTDEFFRTEEVWKKYGDRNIINRE